MTNRDEIRETIAASISWIGPDWTAVTDAVYDALRERYIIAELPNNVDENTPHIYCRANRGRLCVCGLPAGHSAMHKCGSDKCGIRWIEP